MVALLGGLGRAAGGQVLRGVRRRLPGAVGLLLHQLFLGRGDDVAHRRGEGKERPSPFAAFGRVHHFFEI